VFVEVPKGNASKKSTATEAFLPVQVKHRGDLKKRLEKIPGLPGSSVAKRS